MASSLPDRKRTPSLDEKDRLDDDKLSIEQSGGSNLAITQLPDRTATLSRSPSKKEEDIGDKTGTPTSTDPHTEVREERWLTGSKLLIVHSAMLLS